MDSGLITNITSCFTHLESYNKIEQVSDFSEYGLDTPLVTLKAYGPENTSTIEIGNPAPMDSLRYVSIGDGHVYLVDNSIFSNTNVELDDLLEMEELPEVNNFVSISVSDIENSITVDYVAPAEEESSEEEGEIEAAEVWFINGEAVDAALVESLYNSISSLIWTDCVDYKADASVLSNYGLENPVLRSEIVYMNGNETASYGIEVGSAVENENGSFRYIRISGSKMIYTVSSAAVDTILSAFTDLL